MASKESYLLKGAKMRRDGLAKPDESGQWSWQRQALVDGWNHEDDYLPTQGSLTARQEHIRFLTKEINNSKIMSANRLLRIAHKIQVLKCREALCGST